MPFRLAVDDREFDKFVEKNNETHVRVLVGNDGADPIPVIFASANKTTPHFFNVNAPTQLVEYSQALPDSTKEIIVRCRKLSEFKFSFSPLASDFMTVPRGNSLVIDNVLLNSKIIYLTSSESSQVFEILVWT